MKRDITVVTGGSGGMGKAICRELGTQTALLLVGRSEKSLESAKAELDALGMESHLFVADIQDAAQTKALAEYASSLGDIKNVLHTSGVSPTDTPAEKVVAINAVGTVNMVEAFYPVISAGGVMVNFASVAAYTMEQAPEWTAVYAEWDSQDFYDRMMALVGKPSVPADPESEFYRAGMAYVISKRFVIYFTQMNVARFAEKGCRILSASPGSYLTPMHQKLIDNQPESAEDQLELIPLGRWGHPYEIGSLAAFLCSPGAAYINGVDILADGGQTANVFVNQIM